MRGELTKNLKSLLAPLEGTYRLLWFILTLAVFVMLYSVHIASAYWDDPIKVSTGWVFYLIAFVLIAVYFKVQAHLFSNNALLDFLNEDVFPEKLARHKQTGRVDPVDLAKVKQLSKKEFLILKVASLTFKQFVTGLLISVAVTLLGFIYAQLRQDFSAILPFILFSLVMNILCYPRLQNYEDRVFKLGGRELLDEEIKSRAEA
ncbi:MAG: hypothetical protein H6619_04855 [Deltaproteobacteria bacterium]|nr:hypothetical protein [Deltaproteobacteria bacterium]